MTALLAIFGIVLLIAAALGMMYFMPRKGQVHPWATRPFLESGIPLTIMALSIFGLACLAAALS